jgi:hypothetical protein
VDKVVAPEVLTVDGQTVITSFDKPEVRIMERNMRGGEIFEPDREHFRRLIPLIHGTEGNLFGLDSRLEKLLDLRNEPQIKEGVFGTILFDAEGQQRDCFFDNTTDRPPAETAQMQHANSPFRYRDPARKAELVKDWFQRQMQFFNIDKDRGSLHYRIGVLQYDMRTGHFRLEVEDDYRNFGWMIVVKCKYLKELPTN